MDFATAKTKKWNVTLATPTDVTKPFDLELGDGFVLVGTSATACTLRRTVDWGEGCTYTADANGGTLKGTHKATGFPFEFRIRDAGGHSGATDENGGTDPGGGTWTANDG